MINTIFLVITAALAVFVIVYLFGSKKSPEIPSETPPSEHPEV